MPLKKKKIIDKKSPAKIIKKKKNTKQDQDLIKLSRKICTIIHKSNKDFIQKWFNQYLNNNLTKLIEEEVTKEFKNEVIPLLLKQIDIKIDSMVDNIEQKSSYQIKRNIRNHFISVFKKI